MLDAGADKVSVNSAALARPELIDELAERLRRPVRGDRDRRQAPQRRPDCRPPAWRPGTSTCTAGASRVEGRDAVAWAREAVERGAGEVLLTSMDRDGTTDGYDLELTRAVADAVAVPVIASGGAGELDHLVEAIADGRRRRGALRLDLPLRHPHGRRGEAEDGAGRDPGQDHFLERLTCIVPFAPSIAVLSLVQASLIAVSTKPAAVVLGELRGRWWALVLPGSVVLVIAGIALDPGLAQMLTYLALVAVPILAGFALATVIRGARPILAAATVPLFLIAWGTLGSLPGEAAAVALSSLACIALASVIVAWVPIRWLKLAIYAMAAIDTCLVGANLLQGPNDVLNAAAPAAGLPQLQFAQFGSAVIGFGDLFIAAVLGAMLARQGAPQLRPAAIAALLALAFDLLFFFVGELPSTVPIALTLAVLEMRPATSPFGSPTWRRSLSSPSSPASPAS